MVPICPLPCPSAPEGDDTPLSPTVTTGGRTVLHLVAQFLDGGQVATDPVQPINVQTWADGDGGEPPVKQSMLLWDIRYS